MRLADGGRVGRLDVDPAVDPLGGDEQLDELGQLGRAVDQMAERIESLLKSQRRLLQDISHELRSPLARLGVAVELARGGGDPDIAFHRIEREADRLNMLVGELIQVTRAEGDPESQSFEPIDLFHAHIGGMDAFAVGLKLAAQIRKDGVLKDFVKQRYA